MKLKGSRKDQFIAARHARMLALIAELELALTRERAKMLAIRAELKRIADFIEQDSRGGG